MSDPRHAPVAVLLDLIEAGSEDPAAGRAAAAPGTEEWSSHVSGCALCRERMSQIAEVLSVARRGDHGDAPEAWIRRAERHAVPRTFLGPLLGTFVAEVVYDSAFERLSGVRAGDFHGRQVVYACNRLEVELTIAPTTPPSPWTLSGQIFVLPGVEMPLENCRVALYEGQVERERVTASSTGEFLVKTRPRASFRLRIDGDGWSLETPSMDP
jgi:hypothetical protein